MLSCPFFSWCCRVFFPIFWVGLLWSCLFFAPSGWCCSLLLSLGVASFLRLPWRRWVLPSFEMSQVVFSGWCCSPVSSFLGGVVVLVVFLSVVVLSRGRCCFKLSCGCVHVLLLFGAAFPPPPRSGAAAAPLQFDMALNGTMQPDVINSN